MCSLNKKCHPFFELLQRTVLAHSQGYLSFEVYLLPFSLNTDEKLTLWPFWCFLHLYHQKGGLNLLPMERLVVGVSGDVTSARIKLLSVNVK